MVVVVLALIILLQLNLFMVGEQTEGQHLQIHLEQSPHLFRQIKQLDSVLLHIQAQELTEQ